MTKGTKILIIFLLVSSTGVFSQQISHQVIVPVAGLASGGAVTYSQTAGEPAIVVLTSSDYVLTQGFQQPGIKLSPERPPQGSGVRVYPNPVTDYVTIELFGIESRTFRIEFINISGNVILSDRKAFTEQFWFKEPYNTGRLLKGLYLIRVMSEDGIINQTFKIEKI